MKILFIILCGLLGGVAGNSGSFLSVIYYVDIAGFLITASVGTHGLDYIEVNTRRDIFATLLAVPALSRVSGGEQLLAPAVEDMAFV